MSDPVLRLRSVTIKYGNGPDSVEAVRDFSLDLGEAEIVGLVGESGSGKSTIGYAIVGHLGSSGRVEAGEITFRGIDLLRLKRRAWRSIRGKRIAMVFQDPQSALNPAYTIGDQIAESMRWHLGLSRRAARERTLEWLGRVHLPDPVALFHRYPHQLSGGQQQRAVIAMAFAADPELIVMDEPTTGLDVTTQARVLRLIADLRAETGVSILYVSHDLGVVSDLCESVVVMHRGRLVEAGRSGDVMRTPAHPYTQRLICSIPSVRRVQHLPANERNEEPAPVDAGCAFRNRCHGAVAECATARGGSLLPVDGGRVVRCWRHVDLAPIQPVPVEPAPSVERPVLLEVRDLVKHYVAADGRRVVANDHISLHVRRGESVALIGESGSGKSTLAKCLLGIERPSAGSIDLEGTPLPPSILKRGRSLRRRLQIVFQNPDSSLNGRKLVREILARPLLLHGKARTAQDVEQRALALLRAVELPAYYLDRYPHELSGGEKQRVGIARAFASEPDLVVCDEPVSALDVSVQNAVLTVFRRLQRENSVAYLFITHDLGVVRQVADRAIVMYSGAICQDGSVDALFGRCRHPYVSELLASLPDMAGSGFAHPAEAPDFMDEAGDRTGIREARPNACAYFARCRRRKPGLCDRSVPSLREVSQGLRVSCHLSAAELADTAVV